MMRAGVRLRTCSRKQSAIMSAVQQFALLAVDANDAVDAVDANDAVDDACMRVDCCMFAIVDC
jgi:hypothetical protein